MDSVKPNLTPAQLEAATLLASGCSITRAAETVGVSRTTIYSWLKSVPAFSQFLNETKEVVAETFVDNLNQLVFKAADNLHLLLDNPETSPAIRLRTCQLILMQSHANSFPATQALLEKLNPLDKTEHPAQLHHCTAPKAA